MIAIAVPRMLRPRSFGKIARRNQHMCPSCRALIDSATQAGHQAGCPNSTGTFNSYLSQHNGQPQNPFNAALQQHNQQTAPGAPPQDFNSLLRQHENSDPPGGFGAAFRAHQQQGGH